MEKSKKIFENEISNKDYKKAVKSKRKFEKKFGDDSSKSYHLKAVDNPVIGSAIGVRNLVLSDKPATFGEKDIIVGNIRMGFGHYRISMAIASCANALGFNPLWLDLNSYPETTCTKMISHQNDLYSLGSRISQKSKLFNKFVWEPMNSEGFRKLSYNSADQKNAELMVPVLGDLPKDIPYVATHAWPAQAAVHAGLTHVVNAIPDNWQMALHLSEGAIHAVQTPSAYLGYKTLRGMDKKRCLKPMPDGSIYCTGHYIDHEIVSNIEADCERRLKRNGKRRYLLTVGGAGAQKDIFVKIIKDLLPYIKKDKAVLMINVGDHKNVWDDLIKEVPQMTEFLTEHFDNYQEAAEFSSRALDENVDGIHAFYDSDIFSAVYITNLLMRACDYLVTKPSELAFYPIPKLMIKRVGGHEAWGAIHADEVGDGTYECDTPEEIETMLDLLQNDEEILHIMCGNIIKNKSVGMYDGGYNVVKLAEGIK